jgi:outer membrane protein assembly factor BamD (BamD/ComL family)
VCRSTREQIPDFAPEEAAQVLRLAEAARQARDPALALSLIKGFDKRFPHSGEIPAVYFFAAQTLSEDYREDARARQILAHLLKNYPQHPLGDKARHLLNFMERTARK